MGCSLPAPYTRAKAKLLCFAVEHMEGIWDLWCFVCWCGARHGLIHHYCCVCSAAALQASACVAGNLCPGPILRDIKLYLSMIEMLCQSSAMRLSQSCMLCLAGMFLVAQLV